MFFLFQFSRYTHIYLFFSFSSCVNSHSLPFTPSRLQPCICQSHDCQKYEFSGISSSGTHNQLTIRGYEIYAMSTLSALCPRDPNLISPSSAFIPSSHANSRCFWQDVVSQFQVLPLAVMNFLQINLLFLEVIKPIPRIFAQYALSEGCSQAYTHLPSTVISCAHGYLHFPSWLWSITAFTSCLF